MIEARLKTLYKTKIIKDLYKDLKLKNIFQVPKITKICISSSISTNIHSTKEIKNIYDNLIAITGQKPVITKVKKSISEFKIRKKMPIGCKVTLRNILMYEFLDRMINIALPRVKDFRGIKKSQFDNNGNLSIGIKEQIIFPEIDVKNNQKSIGLNITVVTNINNQNISQKLLENFNLPFIK